MIDGAERERERVPHSACLWVNIGVVEYRWPCLLLLIVGCVLVLKVVVVSGGVLILLVLADEVVYVALCLGELHLVHSLSGVPVEEGFPAEHGGELLGDALEHILNGG